MSTVLITGANGHLGSRALPLLVAKHEVHALVRRVPEEVVEGVVYHSVDLSSLHALEKLPAHVDAVIHLAQASGYRDFPRRALETFQVNAAATALLLDYGRRAGASRFILASTGGLYKPMQGVIDEQTPIAPPDGVLSHYFRTKLSAELIARPYESLMQVSILRPFFIYGPGQSEDKLIARLIASVREGRPIHITGQEGLEMNPVHVDDVAELLVKLLTAEGSRTINVAGPDVVSILHIAQECGRWLARTPILENLPGTPDRIVAGTGLFQTLLGRGLRSFDEGLRTWIA